MSLGGGRPCGSPSLQYRPPAGPCCSRSRGTTTAAAAAVPGHCKASDVEDVVSLNVPCCRFCTAPPTAVFSLLPPSFFPNRFCLCTAVGLPAAGCRWGAHRTAGLPSPPSVQRLLRCVLFRRPVAS
ncbi:hypothetical protein E2562_009712 [Oryza meyeriana var. granulata]|uniref:Uncharacterized protein n=1 Tax=Oryza meyeriana var. granulata TaxID=110450 RepID=A0A6G1D1S7_9ORYZ|nr:hypothetical protein E2562_009712 [Oryza meyeriana var. granulata]